MVNKGIFANRGTEAKIMMEKINANTKPLRAINNK
jgi:hypothetical protein